MKNFKDSNSENPFFDAVIYGIMFYKSKGIIIDKNKIKEILGDDFYNDFLEIKDNIKLDQTVFGYFNRSFHVNEVLARCNLFLKFSERRNMYRFLIPKKSAGEK